LLDSAEGEYRALVPDINLGRDKLDGCDVARHARENDPAFPVVYISGDSAEDWASKGVPKHHAGQALERLPNWSSLLPSL
jgi:CheY-like chemotaxis protein